MRTKSAPEEKKSEMIRDWYVRRDRKRYGSGPSSEDVWEGRGEFVEGAFMADLEALEREMAEERGRGEVGGE